VKPTAEETEPTQEKRGIILKKMKIITRMKNGNSSHDLQLWPYPAQPFHESFLILLA